MLLFWADLHICGAGQANVDKIREFQKNVYDTIDSEIIKLGIEQNNAGDRAIAYLYCVETKCPECRIRVPLAPSWVIGKGTKSIVQLVEDGYHFNFTVKMGAASDEIKDANNGTVNSNEMICPHCGKTTPVSVLRHDSIDEDGNNVNGLRLWKKNEFEARKDDVFAERLYAVKYEKEDGKRYFAAPSSRDLENMGAEVLWVLQPLGFMILTLHRLRKTTG